MVIAGKSRGEINQGTFRMGRFKQREAGIPEGKVSQLLQVGKVRNLSK